MVIILKCTDKDLALSSIEIIKLFYPDAVVSQTSVAEYNLTVVVSVKQDGKKIFVQVVLQEHGCSLEEKTGSIVECEGDLRNETKRLVRAALFKLLKKYNSTVPSKWGILTGIRPTKIVHRLLDRGLGKEQIIEFLVNNYVMSEDKADLLTQIALAQRPFLLTAEEANRTVSVYIGIPFCPTKCDYCSFPSYPVGKWVHSIDPFLSALKHEIQIMGRVLKGMNKSVQTIYIGGGTPTVFNAFQLDELLDAISMWLVTNETTEITLEAGRPDTINKDKLLAAKRHGVTRISINPQSMNSETLKRIGRFHTPEEIEKSIELARILGFNNINTDIIIGLPGEKKDDVEQTMKKIKRLRPESMTIHTLAIKRASKINEAVEDYDLPTGIEAENMLAVTSETAAGMNLKPYYLYRQKKILGSLENIGYAKQGFECIYNVQVIEERQTIIGLGGGAGSKFVDPGSWYLTSHYNPKDPNNYITRINEIIEKKTALLEKHFKIKIFDV